MEENKMNKKTHAFAILLCLALASLVGISVRISEVKSSPSATLSLQPATVTGPSSSVDVGKTFNLTLYVANVTNLWSWKVAISWDPSVLNLTSSPTAGSFMGGATLFLAHPTNYSGGSIPELSDTYLSNTSISGSGILAKMTFKIIGPTGSGSVIGISDAVMLDPSTPHNHIAFTTQNATVLLTPTLSLKPTIINGRPPTTNETLGHVIDLNKTFTVSLYVHDVKNLWGWVVTLNWNPTILNFTNMTEGSFLDSVGSTLFLYPTPGSGSLTQITDELLEDTSVNGNGTLATINFKVLAYGQSNITLSDTLLYQPLSGNPLSHAQIAFTTTNATFTLPPLGDLGGYPPGKVVPQFGYFTGSCGPVDIPLFIECYRDTAPPQWEYLGDLGGYPPGSVVPKFFYYDGSCGPDDIPLFIQCYRGAGP
jgi:hypothetical protein